MSVAVLAALGCWRAMGFGADARVFPLLVLMPATVIGVLIAVRGQLRLWRERDNPRFFVNPLRFFQIVFIMGLALFGLQYLGFLTTSAITIPVISFLLGFRKPLPVFMTTGLFLVIVYIVFIQILSRPLPAEIWTWLGN
jgi:hypothetical protein